MKHLLKLGNAKKLQFKDNTFDLIISINTLHNLNKKECSMALKELIEFQKMHLLL